MNDDPVIANPTSPISADLEPDAHGQAALLLAESMLHALVEGKIFTHDEALSVVQTTCEVKVEVAQRTGESSRRMLESLGLLQAIWTSFMVDVPKR